MDPTKSTHQIRLQHWEQMIHECKASGIPTRKWLEKHGINRRIYYYWHKKVQDACVGKLSGSTPKAPVPSFVELPVPTKESRSKNEPCDPAAIIQMHGLSINLMNTASAELIANLMEVISHAK